MASALADGGFSITIAAEEDQPRLFHGIIVQVRIGPLIDYEFRTCGARIVPWFWLLGHTTDCRIYQNVNIPDIIGQVFATYGYSDFEMSVLRSDYPRAPRTGRHQASAEALARVEVERVGFNLHWPTLDDVDMYVPALVAGIFGTQAWMKDERDQIAPQSTLAPGSTSAPRTGTRGGRSRRIAHA